MFHHLINYISAVVPLSAYLCVLTASVANDAYGIYICIIRYISVMAAEMSYLANYNSLLDEHLSEYLSRPAVWRHLRRQGLVNRSGEVVGEEEWRASVHRRDARAKLDSDRLQQQQERVRGEDTLRRAAKRKHRYVPIYARMRERIALSAVSIDSSRATMRWLTG